VDAVPGVAKSVILSETSQFSSNIFVHPPPSVVISQYTSISVPSGLILYTQSFLAVLVSLILLQLAFGFILTRADHVHSSISSFVRYALYSSVEELVIFTSVPASCTGLFDVSVSIHSFFPVTVGILS
jgi:hypothetical protein